MHRASCCLPLAPLGLNLGLALAAFALLLFAPIIYILASSIVYHREACPHNHVYGQRYSCDLCVSTHYPLHHTAHQLHVTRAATRQMQLMYLVCAVCPSTPIPSDRIGRGLSLQKSRPRAFPSRTLHDATIPMQRSPCSLTSITSMEVHTCHAYVGCVTKNADEASVCPASSAAPSCVISCSVFALIP